MSQAPTADTATTKRLQAALRDTRQASREIADAIGAAAVEQYHVTQAISRLELALTALRAVAKGVV